MGQRCGGMTGMVDEDYVDWFQCLVPGYEYFYFTLSYYAFNLVERSHNYIKLRLIPTRTMLLLS